MIFSESNPKGLVSLSINKFFQDETASGMVSWGMNRKLSPIFVLILYLGFACQRGPDEGTFAHDLQLLNQVEDLLVLEDGNAMIAISPSYQGRVFTSTLGGLDGYSLGYFNRKRLQVEDARHSLSSLGGESRMWFGPEVGKFGIFFEPGTPQTDRTISISPDLDTVMFAIEEQSRRSVKSSSRMHIRNASGTIFSIDASRRITLLTRGEIETELNISLEEDLKTVAFSAETWIRNIGQDPWEKERGLLSIWELCCLHPSPRTTVIIPTRAHPDSVTNYFTPLSESRIQIGEDMVFYRGDALYMNKIGIQAEFCPQVFGSYTPERKQLSIVKYSFQDDSLYVNSQWGHTNPYGGDVINVFNGEVNPVLNRAWPFYELETSSSARELNPGEDLHHIQSIFHFEGEIEDLDRIAQKILDISLADIPEF